MRLEQHFVRPAPQALSVLLQVSQRLQVRVQEAHIRLLRQLFAQAVRLGNMHPPHYLRPVV